MNHVEKFGKIVRILSYSVGKFLHLEVRTIYMTNLIYHHFQSLKFKYKFTSGPSSLLSSGRSLRRRKSPLTLVKMVMAVQSRLEMDYVVEAVGLAAVKELPATMEHWGAIVFSAAV
jgi:hypothetical protein